MQAGPNDRMETERSEERSEAANGAQADDVRAGDGMASDSGKSKRWVQLAYDLEQYGNEDLETRGEVF